MKSPTQHTSNLRLQSPKRYFLDAPKEQPGTCFVKNDDYVLALDEINRLHDQAEMEPFYKRVVTRIREILVLEPGDNVIEAVRTRCQIVEPKANTKQSLHQLACDVLRIHGVDISDQIDELMGRPAEPPVVTPQHIEAALMALAWVDQFIGDGNPMLARQNLNIAKANLGGGRCDPMPIPSVSTKGAAL